jgi:VCBS repeat-containing protein
MTQFKHIIVLVLMLTVLGLVAKAQSTPILPYEGATHTYTVNGLQEGVNYAFYITANANGTGLYDDGATGEFDFKTVPTGTIGVGESTATVDIGWNNGASSHNYYVWLEVTIPGGCSNNISLQVTPQANDFDLLSENIPESNTRSCPSINNADGFNPLASNYEAGYTNLEFLVKKANSNRNWSFIPALAVNPDLALGKYIISVSGTNSGIITPNSENRYTVLAADDNVTVNVSIENAPGYTRNVTLEITGQREEQTNLPDSNPSNDKVNHTIEVIPVIGGMGGV